MLKLRDPLGKDKQSSFRTGRTDNRVHFTMPELGMIGAGKTFRRRLETGPTRSMNETRGRGEEVEAMDVMIEGGG